VGDHDHDIDRASPVGAAAHGSNAAPGPQTILQQR
jgi:hypothetical protein